MKALDITNSDTVITFLDEVKNGKYVVLDSTIIDVPREAISRDEFIFDDDTSVLFSVTNQI